MSGYTADDRTRAAALREAGVGWKRIARQTGIPKTTVRRWLDPEFAERSRQTTAAAKRRRTGRCLSCGTVTRYNGHGRGVSEYCPSCRNKQRTKWTRETLTAAIRQWADTHDGEPPTAKEWFKPNGWPSPSSVIGVFGSWANGIEAAGFPKPGRGRRRKRRP